MIDPIKEVAEKLWYDWKEQELRRQAERIEQMQAKRDAGGRRENVALAALTVGYVALVLVLVRFLTR